MADITPRIIFHVAFTDAEYHLVMLALAALASDAIKPRNADRRAASDLNIQLLAREQDVLSQRLQMTEKKLEKAPRLESVAYGDDVTETT